jgi:hypothetical protein
VRCAWAAGAGQRGEWSWGLCEQMRGRLEDSVVVDGGDVRARSGFGLGLEKTWSEEERSGLRTEDAAGGCHGFAGRVSRRTEGCVATGLTVGL